MTGERCPEAASHSENGGPFRYCGCGWMEDSANSDEAAGAAFVLGLKAARDLVARQTDLADLIHFDRPSDFRKGVLTCLAAIEARINEQPS